MQEIIPINETSFMVYDHQTKECLTILNIIELQMRFRESLRMNFKEAIKEAQNEYWSEKIFSK